MARKRRPSMNDVARAAGVSQTTVSLVLNGQANSGIPPATRDRVHRAVDEVGYRTNRLARAMKLDRTDTIGFVSENIATTPFASAMIRGAQDAAWDAGRLLLIFDTGSIGGPDHLEREQMAVDELLERQVDGIVLASMFHRIVDPPPALLETSAVLLDARDERGQITSVVPDEHGAAYAATRHLVERGHTRIAYHTIEVPEAAAAPMRLRGYLDALHDADIDVDPDLVVSDVAVTARGRATTLHLMTLPEPPTALFCFNDQVAMGAYQAVHELGLEIPSDLSVVGFDDQALISAELLPGLTTMALPHYEMGHWAVTKVLSDDCGDGRQHVIECPLVDRDSVADLR